MALHAVSLGGDNLGIRPLVIGAVFNAVATIAVLLRVLSARMGKCRTLHADDYMILLALVLTYANMFSNLVGIVYGGIGLHVGTLGKDQVLVFLKSLLSNIILWASALAAIKVSLLLFYIRIFSIRKFRIAAYTVMVIVVLWWISVMLEEFLLCKPFAFNWDRSIKGGSCANVLAAYIAAGVINLCTDLMVLVLPVPMIIGLQLPVRSKIALTGAMCIGFFVCIITAIRISAVVAFDPEDGTYTIWQTVLWSQLEPTLGITCACIPFMRPILDRFILRRDRSTNSMKSHSNARFQRTASPQPDSQTYPLTESSAWRYKHQSSVEDITMEENPLRNEVMVRKDWCVERG